MKELVYYYIPGDFIFTFKRKGVFYWSMSIENSNYVDELLKQFDNDKFMTSNDFLLLGEL